MPSNEKDVDVEAVRRRCLLPDFLSTVEYQFQPDHLLVLSRWMFLQTILLLVHLFLLKQDLTWIVFLPTASQDPHLPQAF